MISGPLSWAEAADSFSHSAVEGVMNWRDRLGELQDTIAYVMAYAPDRFPMEDYLPQHEQMSLNRIYEEMRKVFSEVASGHGESSEIQECRTGIEESFESYRKGDMKNGFLRIQNVLHVLQRL
jgi:hypothetical protein